MATRLKLSEHFVVEEFDCKDRNKTRVPSAAIPALKRLCVDVLEPMRAKFGVARVNSGYRTEAHNNANNGARSSQHLYKLTPWSVAADCTFQRGTVKEWRNYAIKLLKKNNRGGGVGYYPRGRFVHMDNRRVHSARRHVETWDGP
jgi:uncharacterized protein YcbK (DUF882 family)